MIVALIIAILAAIFETSGIGAAWYLIVILATYMRSKLEVAISAAVAGGLLLDVLSPRPLAITPIMMLVVILGIEKIGKSPAKIGGIGGALVIAEGIATGRSVGMIVLGELALLVLLYGLTQLSNRSHNKQLIVRRQI